MIGLAAMLAPLLIYIGVFLAARKRCSLRAARVGVTLAIAAALTLCLRLLFGGIDSPWEWILLISGLVSGSLLGRVRRVWLVRATAESMRALIAEGGQRVFLQLSQDGDDMIAATKNRRGRFHLLACTSRLLLFTLPRCPERDKISLLVSWLRKEIPGPLPLIRIEFKETR